jgi:hypothetical protein
VIFLGEEAPPPLYFLEILVSDLRIAVIGEYFKQQKARIKKEEYRLYNDFWRKRIEGKTFDNIILTLGYPKASEHEKFLKFPWRGYEIKTITHPHFGDKPVKVFAIKLED